MRTEATRTFVCEHKGCQDSISLTTYRTDPAFGLDGSGHHTQALELGAAYLGWRRVEGEGIACPKHAQDTRCMRCSMKDCSCMNGPRFDVRRADSGEDE